jgi:hypothetical protein
MCDAHIIKSSLYRSHSSHGYIIRGGDGPIGPVPRPPLFQQQPPQRRATSTGSRSAPLVTVKRHGHLPQTFRTISRHLANGQRSGAKGRCAATIYTPCINSIEQIHTHREFLGDPPSCCRLAGGPLRGLCGGFRSEDRPLALCSS